VRSGYGNSGCSRRNDFFRLRGLQFVQPQLQLLDLTLQLFRLASELHAPQLGDQQLQVLDFAVAGGRLRVFGEELFGLREKLFVLDENQRLRRFVIECVEVRKCRAQRHRARRMPEIFLCAREKCTEKQKLL
jgi:hypothetical protein